MRCLHLIVADEFITAEVVVAWEGADVVVVVGGGGAARFLPPVEQRGDVDEEEPCCITAD